MDFCQTCRKHVGERTWFVVHSAGRHVRQNKLRHLPLSTVIFLCHLQSAWAFYAPLPSPSLALSLSSATSSRVLLTPHEPWLVKRDTDARGKIASMLKMCSEPKQDVADDIGFGEYIKELPSRLVEHLQTSTGDQDARDQTRKYIVELEQLQNYPLDPSFHNFAVSGEWQLLYSTSRISAPDTNLKLRSIRSKWDAKNSNIVHDVSWDFTEENDYRTTGTFQVISNFSYGETPSMPARSHVTVDAHELTPQPLNRPPKDPQALVSALQRALPKEYFDPDGAVLDTTFLDPSLRIVCFLGMRFAGVRHVYARVLPPASPELQSAAFPAAGQRT